MEDNTCHDLLLGHLKTSFGTKSNSSAVQSAQPPANIRSLSAQEITSQAINLRDMAGAGFMYWVVGSTMTEPLNVEAFRIYRDSLLCESGNPTDPIERMLIEQLAMAHFNIGRLHIRSCSVEVPKLALAFADAATRLLGEFRRCTLALEDYRAKQADRKRDHSIVDSVKTPNATQINGQPQPSVNGKEKHPDAKLRSNGNGKHAKAEHVNGDLPAWVRKRMSSPIPNGSQPATATASSGKA